MQYETSVPERQQKITSLQESNWNETADGIWGTVPSALSHIREYLPYYNSHIPDARLPTFIEIMENLDKVAQDIQEVEEEEEEEAIMRPMDKLILKRKDNIGFIRQNDKRQKSDALERLSLTTSVNDLETFDVPSSNPFITQSEVNLIKGMFK